MATDLFGEPISVYTAQQAAEDGVLVPVSPRDAVTRTAWEWIVEHTPMDAEPPSCWPVDMMGWFRAGSISKQDALKMIAKHGKEAQQKYEQQVRDNKTLALSRGLIARDSRAATRAEEAGQIFTLYVRLKDIGAYVQQHIIASLDREPSPNCQTMYLRPNELGGVTLMFPEDN